MTKKPKVSLLGRLQARLFWTHPKGETGEQNAQRFVAAVITEAREERVIIMYPTNAGRAHHRFGWVWMMNAAWRARVLELLQDAPVREPQFNPPDSLDGWTFSAYSTVPVPRIAQLTLDQTL